MPTRKRKPGFSSLWDAVLEALRQDDVYRRIEIENPSETLTLRNLEYEAVYRQAWRDCLLCLKNLEESH